MGMGTVPLKEQLLVQLLVCTGTGTSTCTIPGMFPKNFVLVLVPVPSQVQVPESVHL